MLARFFLFVSGCLFFAVSVKAASKCMSASDPKSPFAQSVGRTIKLPAIAGDTCIGSASFKGLLDEVMAAPVCPKVLPYLIQKVTLSMKEANISTIAALRSVFYDDGFENSCKDINSGYLPCIEAIFEIAFKRLKQSVIPGCCSGFFKWSRTFVGEDLNKFAFDLLSHVNEMACSTAELKTQDGEIQESLCLDRLVQTFTAGAPATAQIVSTAMTRLATILEMPNTQAAQAFTSKEYVNTRYQKQNLFKNFALDICSKPVDNFFSWLGKIPIFAKVFPEMFLDMQAFDGNIFKTLLKLLGPKAQKLKDLLAKLPPQFDLLTMQIHFPNNFSNSSKFNSTGIQSANVRFGGEFRTSNRSVTPANPENNQRRHEKAQATSTGISVFATTISVHFIAYLAFVTLCVM